MKEITFIVHGEARPAGSKTAMPIWDPKKNDYRRGPTGRIITRALHPKTKTKESVQAYMNRVRAAAREAYVLDKLLEGAVGLDLTFHRSRPKGQYGTGRNAGKVKASAPAYPITQPDSIKTARAIEDALTKVIWRDDAQVCEHHITKKWGSHDYVEITVRRLTGEAADAAGGDDGEGAI